MQTILLGNSALTSLVDDEDYERVTVHRWYLHKFGYAATQVPAKSAEGRYRQRELKMHRLVTNAGLGDEVHHRDRNPLNNQKDNLEVITPGVHSAVHRIEQGPRRQGYKGVTRKKPTNGWEERHPWHARIELNGKKVGLGFYTTEEAAARAYDKAVLEVYGEIPGLHPYLNFPLEKGE